MPSSEQKAQALGFSDFWDDRYKKAEGDKPTHEWFRAFTELEPFFNKHLFEGRGEQGKKSRVLHLGSGDSVSYPFFYLFLRQVLDRCTHCFDPEKMSFALPCFLSSCLLLTPDAVCCSLRLGNHGLCSTADIGTRAFHMTSWKEATRTKSASTSRLSSWIS